MICPNCENLLSGTYCQNCNTTTVKPFNAENVSDAFYNIGLRQAREGQLSYAAATLEKSLVLNAKNILARNLLGLVYFQTGLLADALKHWVLSVSFQKENNIATIYIDAVQKQPKLRSSVNSSLKLYNSAIQFMKQQNEDMAIIRLKKATHQNPNFVQAHNLLALAYIEQKDYTRALACCQKALAVDHSDTTAMRYALHLANVTGGKQKLNQKQDKRKPRPVSSKDRSRGFFWGMVVTLVLFGVVVIPIMFSATNYELRALRSANTTLEEAFSALQYETDATIERLETENAELTAEVSVFREQEAAEHARQIIAEADADHRAGRLASAAQKLRSIGPVGLPSDVQASLTSLKDRVFPAYALQRYNEGVAAFNNRRYDDAQIMFGDFLIYAPENDPNRHNAIYFLGRIFEVRGDIANARIRYQELLTYFPQSARRQDVEARLEALGN